MTKEEATIVARICVENADGVEVRGCWEDLTLAFPNIDWRLLFKAEGKGQYWEIDVDRWQSPVISERRLIEELLKQVEHLSKLRVPLTGDPDETP